MAQQPLPLAASREVSKSCPSLPFQRPWVMENVGWGQGSQSPIRQRKKLRPRQGTD